MALHRLDPHQQFFTNLFTSIHGVIQQLASMLECPWSSHRRYDARKYWASIHGTAQSARIDANARISRLPVPSPQQRRHAIHVIVRCSHHHFRPRQLDEVRKRVNDAPVRLRKRPRRQGGFIKVGRGREGGAMMIHEAPDGLGFDKQPK